MNLGGIGPFLLRKKMRTKRSLFTDFHIDLSRKLSFGGIVEMVNGLKGPINHYTNEKS